MDKDLDEIFYDVLNIYPPTANSYPIEFDLKSLREIFEFLLQFTTMLCKHFYGNDSGNVDLSKLSTTELDKINTYLMCIGFKTNFISLPANSYNINHVATKKYDKIKITDNTKLKDLFFALKCDQNLHIINFDFI